nr:DEAD/DEAH box helicase [Flavobacteriales bacterium]
MSVPTSLFAALGVAPELLLALTEAGYTVPTPVQTAVIPAVLFGKDVLGIAPTGTGKTVGYVVPILQRILEERWLLPDRHVPVLVLVPTRELAVQVEEVIRSMA